MQRAMKKILIVEDEALLAMLLCRSFALLGFQVCQPAATAWDAIRLEREERPNVVLMDVRLAGELDGVEAASRIVAERDVPIIFMTGYSDAAVRARADALNPAAYLVKPITPDDAIPILDRIFADWTE